MTHRTPPPASAEPVVNQHGETIAVLDWRDNRDSTEDAQIDDGEIIRHRDGTVIVKCQDPAGTVRRYPMPDTATAFYALGLSAHRCNGIDLWKEFDNLPGMAGCDLKKEKKNARTTFSDFLNGHQGDLIMTETTTPEPARHAASAETAAPRLGTCTLAGRAAAAFDRTRRQDPAFDQRPGDVRRTAARRALAREVTEVFGVTREAVTVTDDPDREHGGWRWYRVAVADNGTEYRFTSFDGTVDDLYILAPCPDCGGEIPRAAAADLAGLGRFLDSRTSGRPVPMPPGSEHDIGHRDACPSQADD